MYEPPQNQNQQQPGASGTYDSSALTEAARVAVAAAAAARNEDGGGGAGSEACETEGAAAAEVARAVRVAELLGLRLVGWCLSHDKVRRGRSKAAGEKKVGKVTEERGRINRASSEGERGPRLREHVAGRVPARSYLVCGGNGRGDRFWTTT